MGTLKEYQKIMHSNYCGLSPVEEFKIIENLIVPKCIREKCILIEFQRFHKNPI